jgi:hypothetical protein
MHCNCNFKPLSELAVNFFDITFLSCRMLPQPFQTNKNIQGIKHIVDLDRKLSTLSIEDKKKKNRGMGTHAFCYEPRGGWNQIQKEYVF